MFLLAIYITVAIGVSFICSVLEAVLLSITPSYLAQLRQQGHPAATRLADLKADIDRPLASILTLNTDAQYYRSYHRCCRSGCASSGRVWQSMAWLVLCGINARDSGVIGNLTENHRRYLLARTRTKRSINFALDGLGAHPVCVVFRANH